MKFLYQFSAGDSFVHRLDPRTKLIFLVCFLVATFLVPQPWIMPLVIIGIIWSLAGISPLEYLPFLLFLLPLMLAITLVHLLADGPPFLEISVLGVVPLSRGGLEAGLLVAFRLAPMGIAFIMFSMTTDPFDLGIALHYAGIPYRVSFMIAFALRFFPLLHEEMSIIRNALRARGYQGPGTVALTALPLGLGALRRSQKIALAMELRGFSYAEEMKTRRTILKDVRMRPIDYGAIAAGIAICIAVALYR